MTTLSANNIDTKIPDFLLNPKYRIGRHILLQVVVILITLNIFWDTPDHFIFTPDRIYAWIIYYLVINLLIYFNRYYLAPKFLIKNRRTRYVFFAALLIFAAILVIGILQGFIVDLDESQRSASYSDAILSIVSSVISVGFIVAGISASLIFGHWVVSNRRIDELESANLQSELKVLKNQINPHFLFNMLNNANYMIMDNHAQAAEVLYKLEDLLRYQINDTAKEKVLLSSDIHFLNDFLNLEKLRRDDFEYVITKEGEINDISVPPFMFIPFVENAIKHSQDSEAGSFVHLSFRVYAKKLEFLCENSKPLSDEKDGQGVGGIGLTNIQRRLDLLYPGQYKLEVEDEKSKYTVKLQLKL